MENGVDFENGRSTRTSTRSRSALTGFDLDALLDDLAKRVTARIRTNSPAQISPRLLTIDAAAKYLGRTRSAVDHMVRGGLLPTVRSDRKIFLDVWDLDRFIDENKVRADGI